MPVELEVKVDWNQYKRVAGGFARMIELTAEELAGQLRYEAPRDTGRLGDSFFKNKVDTYTWLVGTNVSYALEVIGKHVRHPGISGEPPYGTLGNPYPDRAIENTYKKLDAIAKQVADELQ